MKTKIKKKNQEAENQKILEASEYTKATETIKCGFK